MTPAGVREVFWAHTYAELKAQVSLRLGFEAAKLSSFTQSLALVAERMFGGGTATGSSSTAAPNGVARPRNSAELGAALASVIGRVG